MRAAHGNPTSLQPRCVTIVPVRMIDLRSSAHVESMICGKWWWGGVGRWVGGGGGEQIGTSTVAGAPFMTTSHPTTADAAAETQQAHAQSLQSSAITRRPWSMLEPRILGALLLPAVLVALVLGRSAWDEPRLFLPIALHVLATVSLYCLMRSTVSSPFPAAASAMLFLVFPLHHEVVYAPISGNDAVREAVRACVSLTLVCVSAIGLHRIVRADPRAPIVAWPAMMAIGVVLGRFGVQFVGVAAVAGTLAIIAAIAVRPVILRAVWASTAFAMSLAVGVVWREWGSSPTMWQRFYDYNPFNDLVAASVGAAAFGFSILNTPTGMMLLSVLALAAITWLAWACITSLSSDSRPSGLILADEAGDPPSYERLWAWHGAWWLLGPAIAASAILFAASIRWLAPVAVALYPFAAGLAILAAVAIDALIRAFQSSSASRAAVAGVVSVIVVGAIGWSALVHVGWQSAFVRARAFDRSVITQLARVTRDPPEHARYLALRVVSPPIATGYATFDGAIPHNLSPDVFDQTSFRSAIGRNDVHLRGLRDDAAQAFQWSDENGMMLWGPYCSPYFPGESPAPWSQVVPFIVDRQGRVNLVRRLVFTKSDGATVRVDLPYVAGLRARGVELGPTRVIRLDAVATPDE